jgi:iron complex outermembrane recepter protein
MKKLLPILAALLLTSMVTLAQNREVTGVVTDSDSGTPVPGANVSLKGTTTGTATDASGKFSLTVPAGTTSLTISFVGYTTQEVSIPESNYVAVSLAPSSNELEEVVISVGRGAQRTIIDNPVPVDNFTSKELATTGQFTFDKALQYRVPSFNTVNTPVNDASTLLDPYEIRNLGPSRTLILINGKRKNLSSLLYVQFAPGRGETGADLSGIPTDAIKRVEILRDGASAQYGSDAIAGVMNVILKDKFEYSSLNVTSGVTSKGDGGTYGLSFNSGSNIGNRGFINYTIAVSQQDNAIRSGIIDPLTEISTFNGYNPTDPRNVEAALNNPGAANIVNFLKVNPTGGNLNGTGATTASKFNFNLGLPIGETGLFYANGAFVAKKVLSNANYRTPYWRKDFGLLHITDPNGINYTGDNTLDANGIELYKGYVGYMPTFEGDLSDYNATLGVKNETNGWQHDVSLTIGGNEQTYTVNNTVNRSLKNNSPTNFKPGGYNFHHVVGNIDISKAVRKNLNVAFGSEARSETYQIIAGDTSSYSREGSNSFPGIRAENARTNSRFNLGAYLDVTYDITDNFLIEGAVRAEKYSDFGSAFVWKLSSRLKLVNDKLVLRGSISTGFRAPTLHQIFAQSTQASFAGSTIVLSGLFNNVSREAFALGIPKLTAEKSDNITLGLGLNPISNLSFTFDYYNITISDRVVYSSSISSTVAGSQLEIIQKKGNLNSVQFFINGLKTRTQGLDVVANYKNINIGTGKLGINVAGNFTLSNEIIGTPNTPKAIADGGSNILNTQIKSLLTEGRPLYKLIGGFDYSIGKFNIVINNTIFGPTKFQDLDNSTLYGSQADPDQNLIGLFTDAELTDAGLIDIRGRRVMEDIKQVFSTAIVTDLNIGYAFSKNISASFTVNNLFNVLPTWKLEALNSNGQKVVNDEVARRLTEGALAFSGRYRILGYNGSQFSQLGTTFMGQLSFKF